MGVARVSLTKGIPQGAQGAPPVVSHGFPQQECAGAAGGRARGHWAEVLVAAHPQGSQEAAPLLGDPQQRKQDFSGSH